MTIQKRESQTFAESGFSENIHICDVNGLQITTITGTINIEQFVIDSLQHHQSLLVRFNSWVANDYPTLDYRLHVSLIKKELADQFGGNHG